MPNALNEYAIAENEPFASAYNILVQRRAYLIGLFNIVHSRNGDGAYQIHLQIMDIEKYIGDMFPRHRTIAPR